MSEDNLYSGGDATVWCENGHDPKIVQQVAGTLYQCPVGSCGMHYRVEVEVTPDPAGDETDSTDVDQRGDSR